MTEEKKQQWKSIDHQKVLKFRDSIDGKDLLDEDEIKVVRVKIRKASVDEIMFAKIFLECYDTLKINSSEFRTETVDYSTELDSYLSQFEVSKLRELVSSYKNGEAIGDFYHEFNIKKYVQLNRKTMEEVIKIFQGIFSLEA